MSRSGRLLELLQSLRGRRRPVSAQVLADALGVSLRTVYRDVATLVGQGAPIEGEAGLGYVLRPGFFLPPLSFDEDETDALILGLRLAAERGDEALDAAAQRALAKIEAVLPAGDAAAGLSSGLLVPRGIKSPHLGAIRRALRREHKLRLAYVDKQGRATDRLVWPVAVGFFEAVVVLAAWCETRSAFRHFRLDRIGSAALVAERYPTRHRVLLRDWQRAVDADEI